MYSRNITVTVRNGVPVEVRVAILGGEGVDDVRAVVVSAAAAVGLRIIPYNDTNTININHLALHIGVACMIVNRPINSVEPHTRTAQPTQLVIVISHVAGSTPQRARVGEASLRSLLRRVSARPRLCGRRVRPRLHAGLRPLRKLSTRGHGFFHAHKTVVLCAQPFAVEVLLRQSQSAQVQERPHLHPVHDDGTVHEVAACVHDGAHRPTPVGNLVQSLHPTCQHRHFCTKSAVHREPGVFALVLRASGVVQEFPLDHVPVLVRQEDEEDPQHRGGWSFSTTRSADSSSTLRGIGRPAAFKAAWKWGDY